MTFTHLLIPVTLAFLSACAKASPPPAPSTIYAWSENTLSLIPHDATPSDWDAPVFEIDKWNFETIARVGITSSIADYCKLDYEALNFFPLMQWQRSQLPKSARNGYEIYVLGVAHGYAMGTTDELLETNPMDCTALEKILDGRFFSQVFGTRF